MKKLLTLIVCCLLVCSLSGCLSLLGLGMEHIPDQNGEEDTSLVQLTREDLVSSGNSTEFNSSTHGSGISSDAGSKYKHEDYTNVTYKFGKLSGVVTAHATKRQSQFLTLSITTVLESGNMEVAIIVDGQYYCSVLLNQTTTIKLEDASGKLVLVRVAGESAKGEVSVTRS